MNKYSKLFSEIVEKTQNDSIKWVQISKTENSNIIFDSKFVYRQFKTSIEINGEQYSILSVEKKFYDSDYEYQQKSVEFLIISNEELVIALNNLVIDDSELSKLNSLIINKNDKIFKLFG